MEKPNIFLSPFSKLCEKGRCCMEYMENSIGEKYKEWSLGTKADDKLADTVFISSPTGSGKTKFILNTFLPYMAQKGKKILYLVNRTVLKEQLEKDIQSLKYCCREAISVELYQKLENKISNLSLQEKLSDEFLQGAESVLWSCVQQRDSSQQYTQPQQWYTQQQYTQPQQRNFLREQMELHKKMGYYADEYSKMGRYREYDCVVCDEAHYFLMDSNYNTNTILSYNFIRSFFGKKLRIYMSATIEQIKEVIERDNYEMKFHRTDWFGFHGKATNGLKVPSICKSKESLAERCYDYIDISILRKREEIVKAVVEGTEKWLVFVDSREFGKKLKKEILTEFSNEEKDDNKNKVVFINSDYKLDSESDNEVDVIVTQNKQSAKVLIATSVLDNGINIKDIELRNIIIITDTETEFIQMLGRKRPDNKRLRLYIYKQTKEHFIRRQRINQRRQRIAEQNFKTIHNVIQQEFDKWNDNKERNIKFMGIDYISRKEDDLIKSQHKLLMQNVMNGKVDFEDIKALFLVREGILYLNPLSFVNLENLNQFYNRILSEFDIYGENAFLREQLRWLKMSDDEADEVILRESRSQFEKSKQKVIEEFKNLENKPMTEDDFIEVKKQIRDDLIVLTDSVGESHPHYKKFSENAEKIDRVISGPFMNFLKKNCGIPFKLKVKNSIYTIESAKD